MTRAERYRAVYGDGPASLDDLMAGPPADPAGETAPPTAAVPVASDETDAVVSISDLCYDGPGALERAMSLRDDVLAAVGSDEAHVTELLEEIFDLVQLGIETNG